MDTGLFSPFGCCSCASVDMVVRWGQVEAQRVGLSRMIPQHFWGNSLVLLQSEQLGRCVQEGPLQVCQPKGQRSCVPYRLHLPRGSPFSDLYKEGLLPRGALPGPKIWEARLYMAAGASASWAKGSMWLPVLWLPGWEEALAGQRLVQRTELMGSRSLEMGLHLPEIRVILGSYRSKAWWASSLRERWDCRVPVAQSQQTISRREEEQAASEFYSGYYNNTMD